MRRTIFLLCCLFAVAIPVGLKPAMAQNSAPSQTRDKKAISDSFSESTRLSTQAKKALTDESAREKAEECPGAASTREWLNCLAKEDRATEANYTTLTQSIRSMLSTKEELEEFDSLEKEWQAYRKHATAVAYDRFKGGTEAPVFSIEADLTMIRSHMRELAFIYDFLLGNH